MRKRYLQLRSLATLPIAAMMWIIMNKHQKNLVDADLVQWCEWKRMNKTVISFAFLIANHSEFRSVLYRRMGYRRILFSWWLRPMRHLYINTRDIGGGLLIQHGFSSIINAQKIGENCKIYHHVTLGYNHNLEAPTLGDNVEVCCGAKILGGVTVGDNVLIGAGAVVVKDVADNSVVAGVPARIIRRLDGVRDLTK